MPLLSVTNLTDSYTSIVDSSGRTEFKLQLKPWETKSTRIPYNIVDDIGDQLIKLSSNGLVSFSIKEDPAVPDELENLIVRKQTSGPINIYVDALNGNDNNTGHSTSPLKTITAALKKLPTYITQNVTINVKAGVYNESITLPFLVKYGSKLLIKGIDETKVIPASGPSSGTFTGVGVGGVRWVALTGAGWTPGDLIGKFLKIGNNYIPIADNTADEILVPIKTTSIATSSFEIVEPAATILAKSGEGGTIFVNNRDQSYRYDTEFNFLIIDGNGEKFNVLHTYGDAAYTNCRIQGGAIFQVFMYNASSGVKLESTHIDCNNTYFGITVDKGDSYLDLRGISCVGSANYSIVAVNNSYVQQDVFGSYHGYPTTSIFSGGAISCISLFRRAYWNATNNGMLCMNSGGIGLDISDSNYDAIATGVNHEFVGHSSHGIVLGKHTSTTSGNADINHAKVTNNGGHGILISGSHSYLRCLVSNVDNNGGYGIACIPDDNSANSISHCNIVVSSSTTLNGNTSGEFTLDGVTPDTLTNLRAQNPKVLVNNLNFNRIAEN